jgi:hypothetical protein
MFLATLLDYKLLESSCVVVATHSITSSQRSKFHPNDIIWPEVEDTRINIYINQVALNCTDTVTMFSGVNTNNVFRRKHEQCFQGKHEQCFQA